MLNETKECLQYSWNVSGAIEELEAAIRQALEDVSAGKPVVGISAENGAYARRLGIRLLNNKLSGLERPMEIIARETLTRCGTDCTTEQKERWVYAALTAWCGHGRKNRCFEQITDENGLSAWREEKVSVFQALSDAEKALWRKIDRGEDPCLPDAIWIKKENVFDDGEEDLLRQVQAGGGFLNLREEMPDAVVEWIGQIADWMPRYLRYQQLLKIAEYWRYVLSLSLPPETLPLFEKLTAGGSPEAIGEALAAAKLEEEEQEEEQKKEEKKEPKTIRSHLHSIYKVDETAQNLRGRRLVYGEEMFCLTFGDSEEEEGKNTFRKITYDRILADAMEAGPLRRYYLKCTDYGKMKKLGVKDASGKDLTKSEPSMDVVLKVTAAVLMNQTLPHQPSVFIREADISNWGHSEIRFDKKDKPGDLSRYHIQIDEKTREPLFEKLSDDGITQISLHPAWMDCGWELVEENGRPRENRGARYWRDDGAGSYLKVGVRYGNDD